MVMGQCGCGDYNGQWRIPGPNGTWYVIGPYHGCNNGCSEPAGLFIDLMDTSDMADWSADELPEIGGPEHKNFGIPVLNLDHLVKHLAAALVEAGFQPPKDYDEIQDALGDMDLLDPVRSAMWDTQKDFEKAIVKGTP
jgi:hypothetical protein